MIIPGIGTAQLGLPYGAYAHESLMSEKDAIAILRCAVGHNISFIDTARAYGESEKRVGAFLKENQFLKNPTLCSKFPRVDESIWQNPGLFSSAMTEAFQQSKRFLGEDSISMMLLHQCETPFLSKSHVQDYFSRFRELNPTIALGVSVYSLEEADIAFSCPWVTHLQCPINLIDQRFVEQTFLQRCREQGVRLIARSIFLQGVLTDNTPIPQVKATKHLADLRASLKNIFKSLTLEKAAISYIFRNLANIIDVGIFGIHSIAELDNNMAMLHTSEHLNPADLEQLHEVIRLSENHSLYDPRTWNR